MIKSTVVSDVSSREVAVSVSGHKTALSWSDLTRASSVANDDTELRAAYESMRQDAVTLLRSLPLSSQGLVVVVWSITGGATWEVSVMDASGDYRRDLMLADEGGSEPHQALAAKSAESIATRLGCSVRVDA